MRAYDCVMFANFNLWEVSLQSLSQQWSIWLTMRTWQKKIEIEKVNLKEKVKKVERKNKEIEQTVY